MRTELQHVESIFLTRGWTWAHLQHSTLASGPPGKSLVLELLMWPWAISQASCELLDIFTRAIRLGPQAAIWNGALQTVRVRLEAGWLHKRSGAGEEEVWIRTEARGRGDPEGTSDLTPTPPAQQPCMSVSDLWSSGPRHHVPSGELFADPVSLLHSCALGAGTWWGIMDYSPSCGPSGWGLPSRGFTLAHF